MEQKQEQQLSSQTDNSGKISLFIVCVGIIAYGFFYSKNTISDLPYLIGYKLPLALLIWGIFYAIIIKKKRGGMLTSLSFIAIYGSLIASALIGLSQQKQEAKQAITEIQKQYAATVKSSLYPDGDPQRTINQTSTTPKAKGEFGEIERFMKDFLNKMASQRNDYLLELEAIGWGRILDTERIKSDKNLAESNFIIKKAKDIVNKYKTMTDNLLTDTQKHIQSLNVDDSLKRSMLSGFESGMIKSRQQIDTMWEMEKNIVLECEKIINFLSDRKRTWVVSEGQILFQNDNDVKRFNSYFSTIQDLAKQQEVLQRQSIAKVNKNLTQLKEFK